mgnify:CR=1 FL=1
MKHIKVVAETTICRDKGTGCGECQASCQSACKTSCTVGNQSCEQKKINKIFTSTNYIYKADVKITTDTEVLIKKVIGKNNKNIITLDNKLIPIDIIKDIEIINKTSK